MLSWYEKSILYKVLKSFFRASLKAFSSIVFPSPSLFSEFSISFFIDSLAPANSLESLSLTPIFTCGKSGEEELTKVPFSRESTKVNLIRDIVWFLNDSKL